MIPPVRPGEVFALLRPPPDAHTLGLVHFSRTLLALECRSVMAPEGINRLLPELDCDESAQRFCQWLIDTRASRIGFSYRLSPQDAASAFGRLVHNLTNLGLLATQGGPIRGLLFAGLPSACEMVQREHGGLVTVFWGDETWTETAKKLGLEFLLQEQQPGLVQDDSDRLAFGQEIIASEAHHATKASDPYYHPEFGLRRERLEHRLAAAGRSESLPLTRAHMGPYLPDRTEALKQGLDWCRQLASSGFLDILSLGTSQLSQSHFGLKWHDLANGGGIPVRTDDELVRLYEASRPMLIRTYSATHNIQACAQAFDESLNQAWHALSLWWFNQLDGRGPLTPIESIRQHLSTLAWIGRSGRPFEANVSHHFAFRGSDDITYVLAGWLGAALAKRAGIRTYILQVMLNTPRDTSGIQDLARARALLHLTRQLEDDSFQVVLQPRAGLDYFSHREDRARAQLAAATTLMDDIEPHRPDSPAIIHVVSYTEGHRLADPGAIDESIRITRTALAAWRRARQKGDIDDLSNHPDIVARTQGLVNSAKACLQAISQVVPDWYTPEGLHTIFAAGFLPVPYLIHLRDQYPDAVRWQTGRSNGGTSVVDENGLPVPLTDRLSAAGEAVRRLHSSRVNR